MNNGIILLLILDLYVVCLNVAQIIFLQNKQKAMEKERLDLQLKEILEEIKNLRGK